MRVVIAPDSFKECLSARGVAEALRQGWLEGMPGAEIVCLPMADGGEGTVDAVIEAAGGERMLDRVTGPLGDPADAGWGLIQGGHVAVMEMAAASGLALLPADRRDPCKTSTRGVGELMVRALDSGVSDIIIGVGGSATNDGGAGLAQALGYRLLNKRGEELGPGGARLVQLDRIDASGRHPRLDEVNIYVACDVNNPLCGPEGASAVYGPQKGASPEDVLILDHALEHFARIVERDLGVSIAEVPGAGAAGGLAGGLMAFAGATLERGLELIGTLCGLPQAIARADLVITGEGSLDGQSAFGKTPAGIAQLTAPYGVPVIAVGGQVAGGAEALYACGVTALFPICRGPQTLAEARANVESNLRFTGRQIARLWGAATPPGP
ncbi:MAG: glycerate kinase [Candidatus Hydrogenedentes bacterium]|nr:glycerate kinase [Candidatus Hydrogenedentota bacterium]